MSRPTQHHLTFVAALRHNKMTAPMVVEGAMTGEMFLAYIEQCLVPTLKRNDIVVMDNCRVHLSPGIRESVQTWRSAGYRPGRYRRRPTPPGARRFGFSKYVCGRTLV